MIQTFDILLGWGNSDEKELATRWGYADRLDSVRAESTHLPWQANTMIVMAKVLVIVGQG
jgi:hypothetical protein